MSWSCKPASGLAQYFEDRLLDAARGDHQRRYPKGYQTEFHKQAALNVLRHEKTDVCAGVHCADLIERIDRATRPCEATIAFVYMTSIAFFSQAAELAQREPNKTWRSFVENRVLTAVEESDGGTWYAGHVSPQGLPAAVAAIAAESEERVAFCVALHLPAIHCRPSSAGGQMSELWFAGAPPRQVGQSSWMWPAASSSAKANAQRPEVLGGLRLIEAASNRDADTVRSLLEARAPPNFQDARGWTALHAACAVKPKWEVLNQLFEVCDPCIRGRDGRLACDLADLGSHDEASRMLKELMQQHPVAKHLPQATWSLTPSKKAALGITELDWERAGRTGKRREGDEAVDMLREFACLVVRKYRTSDGAFRAFDINGNGTLSRSEFIQYAQTLGFGGDVMSVFKAMDVDRQGDISILEFRVLQELYDEQSRKIE